MKGVTVIVPVKDEAGTVGRVLDGLIREGHDILVVDGRSTDGTCDEVGRRGVRLIQDDGRGKGSALRAAAAAASGEILVFMDGDCSHDERDIPGLVAPIQDGSADLVIGSRIAGGSDEACGNLDFFLRTTGSHVITLAVNWRWKTALTDTQNGFRAMQRRAFLDLGTTEDITTIEQEMVMRALGRALRVVEVPSHEGRRLSGRSKIVLWRVWPRYLWCLFRDLR